MNCGNVSGFNLSSYRSCKNLWKSAVEHHSFFRLQSPRISNKRYRSKGEHRARFFLGGGGPGGVGAEGIFFAFMHIKIAKNCKNFKSNLLTSPSVFAPD